MNKIAIKIENLGKKYVIQHKGKYSQQNKIHLINPMSWKTNNNFYSEDFWALSDINFEVNCGDKIGVIGENGAGKSTLLKILSRITEPTTGKISINGRITSLLEIGTGFHPELSGRENIYLNGAILGMSKKEINAKFDEIVAFSEIESFLDTPVKRYSSGMYVRLAFAVAAHLESEILIVDEVLAVGDVNFQKKCLGKMNKISQDGRTVIFVSHNTSAILQLTSKCLLLEDGRVKSIGKPENIVADYLNSITHTKHSHDFENNNGIVKILNIKYRKAEAQYFNAPLIFELSVENEVNVDNFMISIGIHNEVGQRIVTAKNSVMLSTTGKHSLRLEINGHHLSPNIYSVSIGTFENERVLVYAEQIINFEITDIGIDDPILKTHLIKNRGKTGAFYRLAISDSDTVTIDNN